VAGSTGSKLGLKGSSSSVRKPEGARSLLRVPTLHTICEGDMEVPPLQSEGLGECFGSPRIVYHTEGHAVPHGQGAGEALREFILVQCGG